MSNLSLKRIQKEYQKMIKDPSPSYFASPIKDDMFCWHFTIKGPKETEFEGGIYHGVIKLPMTYPNSPPSVMFLTPSGRFETNKDVCLSMTQYHKEEWQAAWTSIIIYIYFNKLFFLYLLVCLKLLLLLCLFKKIIKLLVL